MKQKFLITLMIALVIVSIFGPIIINESYKIGDGYITLWEASDLLSYLGAVISGVGTIFVGIIAFRQNEVANDINQKLLALEESTYTPFIGVGSNSVKVNQNGHKSFEILLGLRNDTNQIVEVINITDLSVVGVYTKEIRMAKCWEVGTRKIIVPGDEKYLRFENKNAEITDYLKRCVKKGEMKGECFLELHLKLLNSPGKVIESVRFCTNIITENDLIVINIHDIDYDLSNNHMLSKAD